MGFLDKMKQGMADASAAASQMGQMPTQQDMDMMQRVTRINNVGIEHPATVRAMRKTGRTDAGGGVEYEFDVAVEPAGGEQYFATFAQYMHEGSMSSWVSEGAAVNVRVDPDDPTQMLLWGGR